MRTFLRLCLLALLLLAALAGSHGERLVAQRGDGEEEPLDTFVPTEKLPADSAISFPVDI